ncbi:MAG TPA: hypothetical protein DCX12_01945 [Chloroflexi bacterium]|jgi:hypothetical protein|nr:hypothetical protein [Chloroflexota bacterium]
MTGDLCQEDIDQIIREVDAEVGDVCRAQAAEGREDVPAPDGPGLYAVVAPDGVTIRVVDGQTTRECLFLIMQKDMTERLLVEESAKMLRDPRESLTSVLLKQTAKIRELRSQYKLDRLPTCRRSDEMSIMRTKTKIEIELEPAVVRRGESRNLAFEATEPFKLTQISVSDETARNFVLASLKVAGKEMIYRGAVPAAMFSPRAVPVELDYFVDKKTVVELSFANTTDQEHDLEVQLTGLTKVSHLYEGPTSESGLTDNLLDLEKDQVMIIGLGRTDVPPKQACNISTQPYSRFKASRLVIPAEIAEHFSVIDMKVGRNSQVVATGSMPAMVFNETVRIPNLKLDPCDVSQFLTLSIENISDLPQVFSAAWVGMVDQNLEEYKEPDADSRQNREFFKGML